MKTISYKHLLFLLPFIFFKPNFALCSSNWNTFFKEASAQIGTPYHFGGDTPAKGFDCSGLVEYLYSKVDVHLPHGTKYLMNMGKTISPKDIQKGDLIFFSFDGKNIAHVAIYLSDDTIIHAPSSGKTINVSTLFSNIYWSKHIAVIKRVVADEFFVS